jgi:hypothetical protein
MAAGGLMTAMRMNKKAKTRQALAARPIAFPHYELSRIYAHNLSLLRLLPMLRNIFMLREEHVFPAKIIR